MPRAPRHAPGDHLFHVLNRKNGDGNLYDTASCYRTFLHFVGEVAAIDRMRILAYCLMPNHWHMLLWPRADGDLARFVQRLTLRHSYAWHSRHGSHGRGHLYQSRYKSFVILDEAYLLTVCRYIERNPVRAKLVDHPAAWRWSSARVHLATTESGLNGSAEDFLAPILEPLPIALPSDWKNWLDQPQSDAELDALRMCAQRGTEYGSTKPAG